MALMAVAKKKKPILLPPFFFFSLSQARIFAREGGYKELFVLCPSIRVY